MLASILGKIGLEPLVAILSKTLKNNKNPVLGKVGEALSDLSTMLGNGSVTLEETQELNRHLESIAAQEIERDTETIRQVNESLRAEVKSDDTYVRRMRPTFGYIMAVTWGAQMLSLAYVIIFETEQASLVVEAMESLGTIWMVGLSVLGIYVYKRSEDKKIR